MSEEAAARLVEVWDQTPDTHLRFRHEETLPGVWVVLVEVLLTDDWLTVGVISGYSHLKFPHRSQ
jgi:hypothetical protein